MTDDKNYRNIVGILNDLRSKMALINLIKGLATTVMLGIMFFGLLIGLTMISWPSPVVRTLIDIVLMLVLGSVLFVAGIRPIIWRGGLLPIARSLEKHYGEFQTRLIGALELYDLAERNRENYSLELIEKTINEAGAFIAEIDTGVVLDRKSIIPSFSRTAVLIVAAASGFILNPGLISQTWKLYSNPGADLARPLEFSLEITPAGGEFYRNNDLEINVIPTGKSPRDVDLYFRFEEGDWAAEPMNKTGENDSVIFEYTFKKIGRSLDIYAVSGRARTENMHFEVIDPPRLVNINLRIDYPDYSGLPDAVGDANDGNVAALKGSVVQIDAAANKPIAAASQLFSDSSRSGLTVEDRSITGSFKIKQDVRYTIMITDQAGRHSPDPIWYDIQTLEDYPPSVKLVFPGTDVNLNEEMILPLDIALMDDYGFGTLNLVWWIVSGGRQTDPVKENIKIPVGQQTELLLEYDWDINNINPLPGDLIYYYCELSDNDIVSGPKWAKSRTYIARLPSLDEILAEVDQSQDLQLDELEEVMKDQEELQKQIDELSREMLKAAEINWEKNQEAGDILEKQKEIAERMQNIAEEMQENFERLEENRLVGEEIAEKMNELRNLIDEVATPEMKEAMEKLQEALRNMDPEELRKALEDFQMSSEELLDKLDRSIALMKLLAVEQKMDILNQLAEKILQDQMELNDKVESAADSSSLSELSGMCQNNSDQFKTLKEQFEQLKEMDSELNMVPEPEKTQADQEINNPQIPDDFSSMFNSMCQGNGGMCQKKGNNLEDNLRKVARALKKAQDAMLQSMKQEIAEKLQKTAEDLLYLSQRQEKLIVSTKLNDNTVELLRDFAGEQSDIRTATARIAEMISEISRQTVFVNISLLRVIGQALANLGDASRYLNERRASDAVNSETMAMSNLNLAVLMLFKANEAVQKSCSGSGMSEMMQKLGQMSQKQGMLNQQTQSLMPLPGMKMSMNQQNALRNLAGQQDALRRQLEELGQDFGQRGDLLGRLNDLAEEMKKVTDDMSHSRVDRRTLERQERILSRLLDAQKSVNRREFSRKRKADTGFDVVRKSPGQSGDESSYENWLSGAVRKALEESYPRKYDRLIKAYFKSLQTEGAEIEP